MRLEARVTCLSPPSIASRPRRGRHARTAGFQCLVAGGESSDARGSASHDDPVFCCNGCRGAYELIRGWGLEEFYQLRDSPGGEVDDQADPLLEDLDDPTLLGRSAPVPIGDSGTALLRSRLSIAGLHCAACSWLLERAPEQVTGWHSSRVNMHARTIDIVFDATLIKLSQIARFLRRMGYDVSPLAAEPTNQEGDDAARRMLADVAIAGFCAANAMWIAVALYAGQFTGMVAGQAAFLKAAGVILGLAAVAFPGRVFFRSAWASIATRTPHMDLPVAVGLLAGSLASIHALLDPSRDAYFDSIACLVFFLLTGRWLQLRQQHRAGSAVAELMRMSPTLASKIDQRGRASRVVASELVAGDHVRVRASESVPVDGVVIEGESTVDRSLLTGESRGVRVVVGDSVEAGTDNLNSVLTLRVTASGDDTRLAALGRSVSEAAQSRTPIVQLANRIGAWFVVTVLVLALVTAWIWSHVDPTRAVGNTVALLIVACPCALALATPLAIAVAIGRLARRDVLIRSGDCLERVAHPGTVFFDKTGTLTEGRMRVTHWHGDAQTLADIARIEAEVNHPIAAAVVDYAAGRHGSLAARNSGVSATDVTHRIGWGVSGRVGRHVYRIGGPNVLDDASRERCGRLSEQLNAIVQSGSTPLVIARDDDWCGVLGLRDPLRVDARQVVDSLQQCGWKVRCLSGDHPIAVRTVATQIGIPETSAVGGLLPEDKLAAIRSAEGPVVMVGDGVNDAAALAAADVGIAVRGGARASLAAAPVVIGNGRLSGVLLLTLSAVLTRTTIRRNFAISIGYNLVAVGLAMTGWITPLIAAALMPVSSLTVLGLTLAAPEADQNLGV